MIGIHWSIYPVMAHCQTVTQCHRSYESCAEQSMGYTCEMLIMRFSPTHLVHFQLVTALRALWVNVRMRKPRFALAFELDYDVRDSLAHAQLQQYPP